MSVENWRERMGAWWDGPVSDHPQLGAHYPWRAVSLHGRTRRFQSLLDATLRRLDEAAQHGPWDIGVSGGKDSTALALLVAHHGQPASLTSCRDDLCWPGEDAYVRRLATHTGLALTEVRPVVSFQERAAATGLLGGMEQRTRDSLSGPWFEALDDHAAHHRRGIMWGLRWEESRTRALNFGVRGWLYQRASGRWMAHPLMTWTAWDVHAWLARCEVPIHPVYLCVDPGVDPMPIRHSWFVRGGPGAQHHYTWLRRWWPELFDLAARIDPEVRRIS